MYCKKINLFRSVFIYKRKDCSKTCHRKCHKKFITMEQISESEKLDSTKTIIEIKKNEIV